MPFLGISSACTVLSFGYRTCLETSPVPAAFPLQVRRYLFPVGPRTKILSRTREGQRDEERIHVGPSFGESSGESLGPDTSGVVSSRSEWVRDAHRRRPAGLLPYRWSLCVPSSPIRSRTGRGGRIPRTNRTATSLDRPSPEPTQPPPLPAPSPLVGEGLSSSRIVSGLGGFGGSRKF